MWPHVVSNKMLLFFYIYGSKQTINLLLWKYHGLPTSLQIEVVPFNMDISFPKDSQAEQKEAL